MWDLEFRLTLGVIWGLYNMDDGKENGNDKLEFRIKEVSQN